MIQGEAIQIVLPQIPLLFQMKPGSSVIPQQHIHPVGPHWKFHRLQAAHLFDTPALDAENLQRLTRHRIRQPLDDHIIILRVAHAVLTCHCCCLSRILFLQLHRTTL